ncbi:MAG: hypothetical protein ACREIC_20400 [Limisphaerales bacterium]
MNLRPGCGSCMVHLVFPWVIALALTFLVSGISGLCAESSNSAPVATNSDASEPIPKLRPPLPEIPPTFWEQHGVAISCAASGLLVVGTFAVWRLTRPKPPVFIPPLQQAKSELEPLREQPETGALLSRVSQVVRHYFIRAFNLPAAELTTTEFCEAISGVDKLDPELASGVAGFLRQCDERKFAAMAAQPPLGAVTQAARFIDQAESHRSVDER